jgi:hypothetical protein
MDWEQSQAGVRMIREVPSKYGSWKIFDVLERKTYPQGQVWGRLKNDWGRLR